MGMEGENRVGKGWRNRRKGMREPQKMGWEKRGGEGWGKWGVG